MTLRIMTFQNNGFIGLTRPNDLMTEFTLNVPRPSPRNKNKQTKTKTKYKNCPLSLCQSESQSTKAVKKGMSLLTPKQKSQCAQFSSTAPFLVLFGSCFLKPFRRTYSPEVARERSTMSSCLRFYNTHCPPSLQPCLHGLACSLLSFLPAFLV